MWGATAHVDRTAENSPSKKQISFSKRPILSVNRVVFTKQQAQAFWEDGVWAWGGFLCLLNRVGQRWPPARTQVKHAPEVLQDAQLCCRERGAQGQHTATSGAVTGFMAVPADGSGASRPGSP